MVATLVIGAAVVAIILAVIAEGPASTLVAASSTSAAVTIKSTSSPALLLLSPLWGTVLGRRGILIGWLGGLLLVAHGKWGAGIGKIWNCSGMGAGDRMTIGMTGMVKPVFRRTDGLFLLEWMICWTAIGLADLKNQTTGVTSTHRKPCGERS